MKETMEKKQIACAFTGHRILKKDFSARNMLEFMEEVIKRGVTVFYNGGARGFDLLSAEATLMMKGKYPQIKLVVCVPHIGQEKYYDDEEKARYYSILKRADTVVVLSDFYYKGCMQARNQYMVDRSDCIITYCKEDKGGTWNTVNYCKQKYPEKEIYYV